MFLEVEKKDLLSSLGKTQNVVDKKNNSNVLLNVLLETTDKTLQFFATDSEVSVIDRIQVVIHKPGQIAVNAKSLFEIVKELNEGRVQLTRQENNWLEIKQGKYRSRLVGIGKEEYTAKADLNEGPYTKIKAAILKDMIEKTVYAISNDETRYFLNGVYFEKTKSKGYIMVSTDGHRLTLINRDLGVDSDSAPSGVIIPKKGIYEIRKLLEGVDSDVEISVESAQLTLKVNQTIMIVRLIEGKFPDYTQLIPKTTKEKMTVNKDSFLTSLKRVALLASLKSRPVSLGFSKNKLEISSNNPDLGDAKEELDVVYEGPDMRIGYNAKYITDILSAIENEEVDFEVSDPLSPALIRPSADKSYTCVVMPMRI